MRFQLTKIVEDRSPVAVTWALEKCLKREAWEIKRLDQQVVALGIGTSRSTVNLSDKAIFAINGVESNTAVQVDAEFQYTWFLPEDTQNHTVRSRFESIFANMRAELDLAPEWQEQPTAENQPSLPPTSSTTTPTTDLSAPDLASHTTLDKAPELTNPTPAPAALSSTYSALPPEHKSLTPLLASLDPPHPLNLRAASVIVSSLVVLAAAILGIAHTNRRPQTNHVANPSPSIQTAPRNSAAPSANQKLALSPLPALHMTPATKASPSDIAPSTQLGNRPDDLKDWLEQWAASERTRDATSQTSFYADDVRPYLSLDHASRDAVYQAKQDAIQKRQGLWTFKIDDMSIRKQGPDEASVLLKKRVMTQTNSVLVSELRISSFLTLKYTPDGWKITGERDLR